MEPVHVRKYICHIRMMVGNERLCAMEPRLCLKRFSPQTGSNPGHSVCSTYPKNWDSSHNCSKMEQFDFTIESRAQKETGKTAKSVDPDQTAL